MNTPDVPLGFARALASDSLADAWLLLAPGRARTRRGALACASALLGVPDPQGHPDCTIFDPEELGVSGLRVEHIAHRKEDVKSLAEALRYLPLAGARRAVLLFDADRMTTDAQGALLKTAEEPPSGTFLLLTAADLGALLPALLSRCRVLRLAPEPSVDLDRRAAALGIGVEDWTLLQAAIGAEETLELEPSARVGMLERLAALRAWMRGEDPEAAWLQEPEGSSNSAEARGSLHREFQGCLSVILGEHPDPQATERWVDRLQEALADLDVHIGPQLLLSELRHAARQEHLAVHKPG